MKLIKNHTKLKKLSRHKFKNLCLAVLIVGMALLFSACKNSLGNVLYRNTALSQSSDSAVNADNLLGTWVSPDADNQILKIDSSEVTFNYRTFSYTVNGNELELYQTYPYQGGIEGSMPYELDGDELTITLGSAFEGYFYGRSGTVVVVRK